jgi:NAD(P)-dependent dehydrogenase (short-subunit alcohol dehydrogenase family)
MSLFSLHGKVAIVTGGGSGIGKSIVKVLATQGAKVFILDLNEQAGRETQREIEEGGDKAVAFSCNVADQVSVSEVFSSIIESNKNIDILVNSAGISHIGNLADTTPDDFEKIFYVNVKGVYHCMHAVIENMKVKGGVILNLASIAASVGIADRFAYSMSKGAVLAMTLSVARDYVKYNIRCNCISPARVHTPFVDNFLKKNYPGKEEQMFETLSAAQPIGRMGKPDEIASLALYLCSNEASFITGSDYLIDGGFNRLR